MHKFQPRVYLVQRADGSAANVQDIELEKFRTFVFPETQFTAVTAYQNQLITKLKIESNPFAKGFRDSASSEYEDSHYPGYSGMPGGMPGMDPFSRLAPHPIYSYPENNNNMMEKARMMMMLPGSPFFTPPPAMSPAPLSISPDLFARYSAMQASLGLYNPALLAAALRQSSQPQRSPDFPLRSPELQSRSPDQSSRYSPYPLSRPRSPILSPGREDDRLSLSPPCSSPQSFMMSPPCSSPQSIIMSPPCSSPQSLMTGSPCFSPPTLPASSSPPRRAAFPILR